jgi:hypothetical protein
MNDTVDRMREESKWLKAELQLRAEIERLRKERDELRCEVCDWVGNHFKEPPQDVAKRNGWNCFDTGVWDCYKEETK